MTTLLKKDRAILRKIRDMVEATHWFKGEYHECPDELYGPDKDMYCLVGFVNHFTLDPEDVYLGSEYREAIQRYDIKADDYVKVSLSKSRLRILDALREAIKVKAPRATAIETFNDRPSTTRKDILEVIDMALGEDA